MDPPPTAWPRMFSPSSESPRPTAPDTPTRPACRFTRPACRIRSDPPNDSRLKAPTTVKVSEPAVSPTCATGPKPTTATGHFHTRLWRDAPHLDRRNPSRDRCRKAASYLTDNDDPYSSGRRSQIGRETNKGWLWHLWCPSLSSMAVSPRVVPYMMRTSPRRWPAHRWPGPRSGCLAARIQPVCGHPDLFVCRPE